MAADIFLKIGPGEGEPTVKGESRDAKHLNTIDVLGWSWGMSQSGTAHNGSGAGAGKVHVHDMSFTKYLDRASPTLMLACCKGTHYSGAKLYVRKAGDKPLEYYIVELKDVMV